MKRKIRRFWREWGLSKDDALGLLGACMLLLFIMEMPILVNLIGALLF